MEFNTTYQKKVHDKEAAACLKKWNDHFPISDTVDYMYAKELAIIIENQQLMNQIISNEIKIDLQLIFDIYSNLIARHLISVQTLFSLAGLVYFPSFKKNDNKIELVMDCEEITAKTRKLGPLFKNGKFTPPEENEINFEDKDLAKKISNNITREVVVDLANNAATLATKTSKSFQCCPLICKELDGEGWYNNLNYITHIINRKTLLTKDYWIYTSLEIGKSLVEYYSGRFPETEDEIFLAGHVGTRPQPIYVDIKFPKNTMLIGGRGMHQENEDGDMWYYTAGYQYCPYIPLTTTPTVYPDKMGLLTRYGKKLLRAGAKYYALIEVKKEEE